MYLCDTNVVGREARSNHPRCFSLVGLIFRLSSGRHIPVAGGYHGSGQASLLGSPLIPTIFKMKSHMGRSILMLHLDQRWRLATGFLHFLEWRSTAFVSAVWNHLSRPVLPHLYSCLPLILTGILGSPVQKYAFLVFFQSLTATCEVRQIGQSSPRKQCGRKDTTGQRNKTKSNTVPNRTPTQWPMPRTWSERNLARYTVLIGVSPPWNGFPPPLPFFGLVAGTVKTGFPGGGDFQGEKEPPPPRAEVVLSCFSSRSLSIRLHEALKAWLFWCFHFLIFTLHSAVCVWHK